MRAISTAIAFAQRGQVGRRNSRFDGRRRGDRAVGGRFQRRGRFTGGHLSIGLRFVGFRFGGFIGAEAGPGPATELREERHDEGAARRSDRRRESKSSWIWKRKERASSTTSGTAEYFAGACLLQFRGKSDRRCFSSQTSDKPDQQVAGGEVGAEEESDRSTKGAQIACRGIERQTTGDRLRMRQERTGTTTPQNAQGKAVVVLVCWD